MECCSSHFVVVVGVHTVLQPASKRCAGRNRGWHRAIVGVRDGCPSHAQAATQSVPPGTGLANASAAALISNDFYEQGVCGIAVVGERLWIVADKGTRRVDVTLLKSLMESLADAHQSSPDVLGGSLLIKKADGLAHVLNAAAWALGPDPRSSTRQCGSAC